MSEKQCSSCGGNCGGTKKTGCMYGCYEKIIDYDKKLIIAIETLEKIKNQTIPLPFVEAAITLCKLRQ